MEGGGARPRLGPLTVRRARREKGESDDDVAEEATWHPKAIHVHEHARTEKNDGGEDIVAEKKYYQLLCG